jgi:universal stress protein E
VARFRTGERWHKARASDLPETADVTFVHGLAPIMRQMMTHAGSPVERVQEQTEREFQSTPRAAGRFVPGLIRAT